MRLYCTITGMQARRRLCATYAAPRWACSAPGLNKLLHRGALLAYATYSALGNPVLDDSKWPRGMNHLTDLAHSLNLTAGWYGNACGCAAQPYPQCCSDHCDTLECFAGDINATLSFGG
jgi:hypothetical protein